MVLPEQRCAVPRPQRVVDGSRHQDAHRNYYSDRRADAAPILESRRGHSSTAGPQGPSSAGLVRLSRSPPRRSAGDQQRPKPVVHSMRLLESRDSYARPIDAPIAIRSHQLSLPRQNATSNHYDQQREANNFNTTETTEDSTCRRRVVTVATVDSSPTEKSTTANSSCGPATPPVPGQAGGSSVEGGGKRNFRACFDRPISEIKFPLSKVDSLRSGPELRQGANVFDGSSTEPDYQSQRSYEKSKSNTGLDASDSVKSSTNKTRVFYVMRPGPPDKKKFLSPQ
eukprot:Selendium_serpulae@DN5555_c0_g1_i3.p2